MGSFSETYNDQEFLSYVTVLCKGPIARSVIFVVDYK